MFNVTDLNLKILDKPRYDRIIVLPLEKGTASEILLVDENREQPKHGVVLDVGPGGEAPETGRPVKVLSQVGQLVKFGRYAGLADEVLSEDEQRMIPVLIMRDVEVLTYREAGSFDLVIHDRRNIHLVGTSCDLCPKPKSVLIEEERERLRQEREAAELKAAAEAGPALVQATD